ncbi:MAG: hypothetical protein E7I01_17130, partial [Aeromonas sp.]|uniref:hypothetical protein n=1 Tax=Aeromonas sp. TaxID=647 RepID=UPI00290DF929
MVPSWRDQARGNSGSRDDRLTFSCQCHLGEQLHNKRPAAGQLPTTGADGQVAATISKSWVIIGKPINPAYSGTDEP